MTFLTCLLAAAAAWGEPMSFELKASTSSALIGAPVELVGAARFPERFALSLPAEELSLSSFSVASVRLEAPRVEGGMKVQPVRLKIAAFDLGSLTFPSLAWSLQAGSDEKETLRSPPVKLEVAGPDPKSGDLRDIKEPLSPPLWAVLAFILVLLVTLSLVGYEAWHLLRPKGSAQARALVPRKPPYEEALEALEALETSSLAPREVYDRCAEILRVYLERRFAIPAPFLTTGDLLRMMRQAEIDRPVVGLTRDLLGRCDLVKFAKLVPEGPELRHDLEAAIQIVKATAPKPPPEPAAAETPRSAS